MQRTLAEGESFSTFDLLVKTACFMKKGKILSALKAADLN
jgi:hypothetical protein